MPCTVREARVRSRIGSWSTSYDRPTTGRYKYDLVRVHSGALPKPQNAHMCTFFAPRQKTYTKCAHPPTCLLDNPLDLDLKAFLKLNLTSFLKQSSSICLLVVWSGIKLKVSTRQPLNDEESRIHVGGRWRKNGARQKNATYTNCVHGFWARSCTYFVRVCAF